MGIERMDTRQVAEARTKADTVILDVRSVDAYNGWTLGGEPRGGHIAGAKSFPLEWTRDADWWERIQAKGLSRSDSVVVYDRDPTRAEAMAERLQAQGVGQVGVYGAFLEQWCPNEKLPMQRMPRYRNLVPPDWLVSALEGEPVPEPPAEKLVVCHAHYRNPDDYDLGHIPGAVALDTLLLEDPRTWNRRSPKELARALTQLGIDAKTTVVLYGRHSNPDNRDPFPGSNAGHLGAMRCASILLYAGVSDVRVLNGGIHSWEGAGFDLETKPTHPGPISDFGADIPVRPDVFVDLDEAKELLAAEDGRLVSIRSWKEFVGEVSGYNYIDRKGRIPGAVFGNCGSDAYHMETYRNPDHTTREYHEIEAMWIQADIRPEHRIAFYCGTGWRAGEAFMNSFFVAWPHTSVYDGGWMEWSSHPELPVETGIPEGMEGPWQWPATAPIAPDESRPGGRS